MSKISMSAMLARVWLEYVATRRWAGPTWRFGGVVRRPWGTQAGWPVDP